MTEVKRFTWDEDEGGWCDSNGELFRPLEELVRASDYDALSARCAELERDAARYRWLREADVSDLEPLMEGDPVAGNYLMGGESLDAAIDSAMSTEAEEAGEVSRIERSNRPPDNTPHDKAGWTRENANSFWMSYDAAKEVAAALGAMGRAP